MDRRLCESDIHPWTTSDAAYVGLQFGYTLDREHALGLMMHRDRVVDIDHVDVSFAWAPDEAEEANDIARTISANHRLQSSGGCRLRDGGVVRRRPLNHSVMRLKK